MKKCLLAVSVLLMITSCQTVKKSSATIEVRNDIESKVKADLVISNERITYSYRPKKKVRRGGYENIKSVAVSEALRANGNADILVEPQYETVIRRGLTGKKVKSVTVTGYPASYKSFKTKPGILKQNN